MGVGVSGLNPMVRYYSSRQSHRGGDVKLLGSEVTSKLIIPRGIVPREWSWKEAIGTPRKLKGEHSKVHECSGYLLSLRWRLRARKYIDTKFLHFADLRVTLVICTKGRTSSLGLCRALAEVIISHPAELPPYFMVGLAITWILRIVLTVLPSTYIGSARLGGTSLLVLLLWLPKTVPI